MGRASEVNHLKQLVLVNVREDNVAELDEVDRVVVVLVRVRVRVRVRTVLLWSLSK